MKFIDITGYGIFFSLSLIVSFLISSFEIVNDLGFRTERGLHLFASLLIILFIGSIILNKRLKLFGIFVRKKYAKFNFVAFLVAFIFSLFIINSIYGVYTFNYDMPSEDYWKTTKFTRNNFDNLTISSVFIVISLFLAYSYLFNSSMKKLNPLKASVFSLIFIMLAVLAFFVVFIMVRIVYYILLLVTAGISVG